METASLIVFLLVYLGMILGFWPGLALDRTGIALLGAIAFIGLKGLSVTEATSYVDLPALAILFSFMIISAQFYFSGFYTHLIERMEKWKLGASQLLLVVLFVSALLSAVLINDIVCLALTPLIIKLCSRKSLNPVPYLVGLACSSNIGSALTLVGNPQNLLIGQVMNISFIEYLRFSFVPCVLSLFFAWLIIKYQNNQERIVENKEVDPETIQFNQWQSRKGIIVITILLLVFFFTDIPRDQAALVAAGFLLLSRKMASQTMLSFIDWQLLVLFIGLFIVNRSFLSAHNVGFFSHFLESHHINLNSPFWLILVSLVLSNVVSNVPAVMLLLPFIKTNEAGSLLALSSTLAGNMFVVGSIANLIVISQAAQYGVKIDWKQYMKIGLPVTLVSFAILLAWLALTQFTF